MKLLRIFTDGDSCSFQYDRNGLRHCTTGPAQVEIIKVSGPSVLEKWIPGYVVNRTYWHHGVWCVNRDAVHSAHINEQMQMLDAMRKLGNAEQKRFCKVVDKLHCMIESVFEQNRLTLPNG